VLTLTLMNHTFEIPCEPQDREKLIEAATLIEDKLDQATGLRGESKALMVALNLAFDYLQLKEDTTQYSLRLENQLDSAITQVASDSSADKSA